jgi:lysophospholipase L1-like esterase
MGGQRRVWILIVLGCVVAVATACAGATRPAQAGRWLASWSASPEPPVPLSAFPGGFQDQTVRNIIFTSAGGPLARIRFDNTFGTHPLQIGAATIAVAGKGGTVVRGTSVELTFAGRRSTVIPAGAQAFSDPARMTVRPLELLAVSVFLPQATGPPTVHSDAQRINYVAAGNHVFAPAGTRFKGLLDSWYLVSGLDVRAPGRALGAVVALGDSITNGVGSGAGSDGSWPDDLARRLNARAGPTLSVVDAGIDGNHLLNPSHCCGPSGLERFNRDVLGQSGVREVIVLEGINDIGSGVSVQQITAGYQQLISRAHAAGLKIFGATLMPFAGSKYWRPTAQAERAAVNAWIRTRGRFDGVIDFARAVADPRHPERLNPRYDWGDHLHPNGPGYKAMANAVNLAMLLRGLR